MIACRKMVLFLRILKKMRLSDVFESYCCKGEDLE